MKRSVTQKQITVLGALFFVGIVVFVSCQKETSLVNDPSAESAIVPNSKEYDPMPLKGVTTSWPIVCVTYTADGKMWTLNTSTWVCPNGSILSSNGVDLNYLNGVAQKSTTSAPLNNYVVTTGSIATNFPSTFFEVSGSGASFTVTNRGGSYAALGGLVSDIEFRPGDNTNLYGIYLYNGNYFFAKITNWNNKLVTPSIGLASSALNTYSGFSGNGPFGLAFDGVMPNIVYIYDKSSGKVGRFQLNASGPIAYLTTSGIHFTSHATARTCLGKSGNILFIGDNSDFNYGTWQSSVFGGDEGCYPEDISSFPKPPCIGCSPD